MYTDTFPRDAELGECPSEMIRHLLAAADRYALDQLKLSCAQKLWDIVSVDTVAATLACAEMYNCLELKIKCIDFFAMEKNFRKAVLTDGFVQLVQQFPSIVAELRERPVAVYSSGMQDHPIDFCFHEFRLDYEQTKHLAVGKAVYSDPFSAGGHTWKITCFPCGIRSSDNGEHLSVFVELENQPRLSVSAIFEVFLMDKDGQPSLTAQQRTGVHLF
jgi:speckle-type POZ protein